MSSKNTQCLSEEALVAVLYGDAPQADIDHRLSCIDCARRFKVLEKDMALIGDVLSEPAVARVPSPARVWLPMAAAVVVGFAVLWSQIPQEASQTQTSGKLVRNQLPVQTDVVLAALESDDDLYAYLDAALKGDLPCGWDDPLFSDCNRGGLQGIGAGLDGLGEIDDYGYADADIFSGMFGIGS